jgi:hypothetical protein
MQIKSAKDLEVYKKGNPLPQVEGTAVGYILIIQCHRAEDSRGFAK